MSNPTATAVSPLVDIHDRLEGFAVDSALPIEEAMSSIARISRTLDPLQRYPNTLVTSQYNTPLGHMVSLLQEYFHGADGGDDAYIRDRLFAMVGEMIERTKNIEREIAWVIPRLLEPLMADRGWSAMINPAGNDYATGAGRTLAPFIPQALCDDVLTQGADALICLSQQPSACDPAWQVLEMVSPAYLDFFVVGATPVISSNALARDVPNPFQEPARAGPRL